MPNNLNAHAVALHDEARSIETYGSDATHVVARGRALRAGALALNALDALDVRTLEQVANALECVGANYNATKQVARANVAFAQADAVRAYAFAVADALDRIRA
jgi:hypothetical protein